MFGLLNVNKPQGITSRDVVNHIQRIVRPVKVGHGGTLDPLATGVLLVCLGPATRLTEYLQRMPKQYIATFLLGKRSDTEDIQGRIVELPDGPRPSLTEVNETIRAFVGTIQQRPPAFSALKVRGQRAYALARAGKSVELAPRRVRIDSIALIDFEYPRLTLDIRCGGGTYVRSLGRDIAAAMGTAAVMSVLERTAIGSFRVDAACELEKISAETLQKVLEPASRAVEMLPLLRLTTDEVRRVANGLSIDNRMSERFGEVAALDAAGQLVAILVPRPGGLGPIRNFGMEPTA